MQRAAAAPIQRQLVLWAEVQQVAQAAVLQPQQRLLLALVRAAAAAHQAQAVHLQRAEAVQLV
jgi:hypothetical protein